MIKIQSENRESVKREFRKMSEIKHEHSKAADLQAVKSLFEKNHGRKSTLIFDK
jgi:hypothetical protein